MGIDPVSEDYYTITNYQFAHNNPVWKIEIEGLEGTPSNNSVDVINSENRYFSRNIILNTIVINSQKEKHSRAGVPTLRYGVGFDGQSIGGSVGNDAVGAEGSVNTVQLSFGMSISEDGECIEYNTSILDANGSVNAFDESMINGNFTVINSSGSYNLRTKESNSEINIFTNSLNTAFGSDEQKSKENDLVAKLNLVGGYVEANLSELTNNLADFGNLISSWLESVVREHFDPDDSRANPILD